MLGHLGQLLTRKANRQEKISLFSNAGSWQPTNLLRPLPQSLVITLGNVLRIAVSATVTATVQRAHCTVQHPDVEVAGLAFSVHFELLTAVCAFFGIREPENMCVRFRFRVAEL